MEKGILRIIGIQILEHTELYVRKSLDFGWYPFVKCDNDIKMDKEAIPIVSKHICPKSYYRINPELPEISICAIVGKNGSGKSTLLDILYRILNNFSAVLLESVDLGGCTSVHPAPGVHARLFFEIDETFRVIECEGFDVRYYRYNNDNTRDVFNIDVISEKYLVLDILRKFFYTISVNYSLYAFNPNDVIPHIQEEHKKMDDPEWLDNMFHKNDGYLTPLVFTPYREEGSIDVNNETNLALQRLSVLALLFHSQNKELLSGYKPTELLYRYNKNYRDDKLKKFRNKIRQKYLVNTVDLLVKHFEYVWHKIILDEHSIDLQNASEEINQTALFFLAYKSVKICLTYPSFMEKLKVSELEKLAKKEEATEEFTIEADDLRKWLSDHTSTIKDIVIEIKENDISHITAKIHQCLAFIKTDRYHDKEGYIPVEELLADQKFKLYDEVLDLLPPAFFTVDLKFEKKRTRKRKVDARKPESLTFQTMSSGERQMLYSLSYVFYHIKNISTIKEDDNRVAYHHINLIFDEAELYYHPEFQREFVKYLLDSLALCNIDQRSIYSINIIIITHSPFLLSDIPETNILFLGEQEDQHTFGANIYDLLKSSFFMDYTIGDFARQKIDDLIEIFNIADPLKKQTSFLKRKEELRFTAEYISDEYLQKTLRYMYETLEKEFCSTNQEEAYIRHQIELKQREIKELEKKLNNEKDRLPSEHE